MTTNNATACRHCFLLGKELEQQQATMLLIVVTCHLPQNLKRKTSCTHHLPSQLLKKRDDNEQHGYLSSFFRS
jgi:hypothetical protein